MNRRCFLAGTASALALAALGPPARADEEPADLLPLRHALAAATARGKPLLVFVVPDTPEGRWAMGGAFGDLLYGASDETLGELALADVFCASAAAVRAIQPPAVIFDVPRPFELLETDPRVGPTSIATWELPRPRVPYGFDGTELPKDSPGPLKSRITRMSTVLHGGLAKDADLLARRADQLAAVYGLKRLKKAYQRFVKGKPVSPLEVHAYAASFAYQATLAPEDVGGRITGLLAGATRAVLVERDPPGARWVVPRLDAGAFEPGPSAETPYLVFPERP